MRTRVCQTASVTLSLPIPSSNRLSLHWSFAGWITAMVYIRWLASQPTFSVEGRADLNYRGLRVGSSRPSLTPRFDKGLRCSTFDHLLVPAVKLSAVGTWMSRRPCRWCSYMEPGSRKKKRRTGSGRVPGRQGIDES